MSPVLLEPHQQKKTVTATKNTDRASHRSSTVIQQDIHTSDSTVNDSKRREVSFSLPLVEDSAVVLHRPEDDEDEDEEDDPLLPFTLDSSPPRPLATTPSHFITRTVSSATLLREQTDGSGGGYLHETHKLITLAIPLVITNMSSFLVGMVGIVFVGHLGKFELSVAVLAASIFNVTGLSFLLGSLGALETLCSQAYGAKNYHLVGIALQRAIIFTNVLALCVSLSWTKASALLLVLGQEASLAGAAGQYLQWCIPALFFVGTGDCLKRYLTAQNVVAPSTWASIFAMVTAPLFNYLFVIHFKMGLFGAAMAGNCAQAAPLLTMIVWMVHRERLLKSQNCEKRTWHGWSTAALSDWKQYLQLAGPSAAMVCLEWSTFEACVIFAGWLADPEQDVAVMGLTLNVSGLLYMLPMGLGAATSVRVGNALGAGLPRAARQSAYVGMSIVLVVQFTLAAVTVALRNVSAFLFTSDVGVAVAAAPIFPIMAWCLIGDGLNATAAGVLRGAGRQELGAVFNLVAYWVIGLPLAGVLAFKAGLGVIGLWIGLSTCASFNGVAMSGAVVKMNWVKEARRATGGSFDDDDDCDGGGGGKEVDLIECVALHHRHGSGSGDAAARV